MSERYIIQLMGFVNLPEGGQDHCDDGNPDGWNVWLRDNEGNAGEPFTSVDAFDADFNSLEAARLYASALSERFGAEIDEY